MINNTESKKVYEVQSGVTEYPIGFPFHFNADQTPQLYVVIGHDVLQLNYNCKLSEDKGTLILIPTEEEAEKLTGPDDYSWMDKWVGAHLVIKRDIPFVQESDYQLGRISAEQIEHDFDASVMRDQMLAEEIGKHTVDVQAEVDAINDRIDGVQQEHAEDMEDIDAALATKATKTELENAKTTLNVGIQGNAQAIQKTREDYINADSEIHQILNSHTNELTTLRGNQASLGVQVSNIEHKIPESASGSNPLITKQQLLDEEMDIRDDLNGGLSELQTQITTQAAEIATKQDQLIAGNNITIVNNVISATGGGGGGGGGTTLPDQAGNAGKFLMTDGTEPSWGNAYAFSDDVRDDATVIGELDTTVVASNAITITGHKQKTRTASSTVAIGGGLSSIYSMNSVIIGSGAGGTLNKNSSIAIGAGAHIGANNSILLSANRTAYGLQTSINNDANTFKVANLNGTFEIMSADGTMPTDRYTTTPTGAGTYVPKLTIAEDGTATREWGVESGGGGASGDYLPLSGGTLTGKITRDIGTRTGTGSRYDRLFDFSGSVDPYSSGSLTYSKLNAEYALKWNGGEEIRFLHGENSTYGISLYFSNDVFSISPVVNTMSSSGKSKTLGKKGQWWDAVYTKYIHAPITGSSSDDYTITVPSKKGTMATIEDISAIGGEGTKGQVLTKTDDGFAWQEPAGGGTNVIFREWEE